MYELNTTDIKVVKHLLLKGPKPVKEIARALRMTHTALYKSLVKLTKMDITIKDGQTHCYSLHPHIDDNEPYIKLGDFVLEMLLDLDEQGYDECTSQNPPLNHIKIIMAVVLDRLPKTRKE